MLLVGRFHVGEQCGHDAKQGEECAHAEYKLYVGHFGKPSEECGSYAAQAEREAEKQSGDGADMCRLKFCSENEYGRGCR